MARKLEFTFQGETFSAAIHKVDRTKLYGSIDVETLDTEGKRCELATLANDGRTLIPYGGTALGYVNADGWWVDRADLKSVDLDGNDLPTVESSFSKPTELSLKVSVEDFLDHSIRLCYALEGEGVSEALLKELSEGVIYRIDFSYRGGSEADPAFVLQGGDGTPWLLVGVKNEFTFLGLEQAGAGVSEDDEAEDGDGGDDGFDFEML